MSATVERQSPGRFMAWCEKCRDGVGQMAGISSCVEWAQAHNERNHEEPK